MIRDIANFGSVLIQLQENPPKIEQFSQNPIIENYMDYDIAYDRETEYEIEWVLTKYLKLYYQSNVDWN